MEKVFLISLGCPKNQVDSEVILGLLAHDGLVLTSSVEEADVVIVNTCAFIQEAVQESIEVILELVQLKGKGAINKLIVTGCLPQRYGEGVAKEIPEVDLWIGTGEFLRIPRLLREDKTKVLIGKPQYLYDHYTPRIITNSPHSAYVKIAEGCSHPCTFCLIPQLRGRYRSREFGRQRCCRDKSRSPGFHSVWDGQRRKKRALPPLESTDKNRGGEVDQSPLCLSPSSQFPPATPGYGRR
jgi:ribosomal protein S12 methylthiotransferase